MVVSETSSEAMRWIASEMIYLLVSGLLAIVVVGAFIAPVVFILGLIFPIIGALKAKEGELWPYPMSIEFLK